MCPTCLRVLRCHSCVVLGVNVRGQDYIKFGSGATQDVPVGCTADRLSTRWMRIVIVRYAIMTPYCALFLLVSYTRVFKESFSFGQVM